jgi:O-antigen biosynthesis protein WbqP
MKRIVDLVGSVSGLLLLWPVALIVGVAVKLDSPGPILFSQNRVGRGGCIFRCHKFRSMHVSAPERPTHESVSTDATRVGRFLRRTKLDEVPQFINVLLGDMSLVGPRPCLPSQTVLIEARRRLGVNDVRPGITGLAQVNGIDMSEPERLARVDAVYVKNASVWMDLRLILASLPGGHRLRPPISTT